jgi:hypothetical protein
MRSRSDKTTHPDLTFSFQSSRSATPQYKVCWDRPRAHAILQGSLLGAYLRQTEAGKKRRSLSQVQWRRFACKKLLADQYMSDLATRLFLPGQWSGRKYYDWRVIDEMSYCSLWSTARLRQRSQRKGALRNHLTIESTAYARRSPQSTPRAVRAEIGIHDLGLSDGTDLRQERTSKDQATARL